MKKYKLIALSSLFLLSCNSFYEISLEEAKNRFNNCYKNYSENLDIPNNFVAIEKTNNNVSKQIGFDYGNIIYYELDGSNQKWFTFEDNTLTIYSKAQSDKKGTRTKDESVIKTNNDDKINYFKSEFSKYNCKYLDKVKSDLSEIQNIKCTANNSSSLLLNYIDSESNNIKCYISNNFFYSYESKNSNTTFSIEFKFINFNSNLDKSIFS